MINDTKPCCNGALAPVEATAEMTQPVGQRDGQLYAKPPKGLPDATPNGALLEVVNGDWAASMNIPNRVGVAETGVSDCLARITTAEGTILELSTRLDSLIAQLREVVGGDPEASYEEVILLLTEIKEALRESINRFGSDIVASTEFSAYSTKLDARFTALANLVATILNDGVPVEDLAGSISEIESVKEEIAEIVNATLPGRIGADTRFRDYPMAVDEAIQTGGGSETYVTTYIPETADDIYFSGQQGNSIPRMTEWVMKAPPDSTRVQLPAENYVYRFFTKIKTDPTVATLNRYPCAVATGARNDHSGFLEEFEFGGTSVEYPDYYSWESHGQLHSVVMDNLTTLGNGRAPYHSDLVIELRGARTIGDLVVPAKFSAAKFEGRACIKNIGGTFTSSHTGGVQLQINIPKVTAVGIYNSTSTWNSYVELANCGGVLELPAAQNVGRMKTTQWELDIYMPELRYWGGPVTDQTPTDIDFFIGPNLTAVSDTSALLSLTTELKVHIPPGDSITKTTLDTLGVAYTQDYII